MRKMRFLPVMEENSVPQNYRNILTVRAGITGQSVQKTLNANYANSLSEIEKKNVELLKSEEYSRSANGYQLDQ